MVVLQTDQSLTAMTVAAAAGCSLPTPVVPCLTNHHRQRKVRPPGGAATCYSLRRFLGDSSSLCPAAAKKPTDVAPKPRKPPAPKTKKPDKSIWDSDSDTEDKKPSAALKGTGKGRGRKRKGSDSEEDYSPMKKMNKPVARVSVGPLCMCVCACVYSEITQVCVCMGCASCSETSETSV